MRVAALYDIHGNLPALEAVLAEVEEAEPDVVVVGGDVVLGPMPSETLELLLGLGERALFVRGNCDRLMNEEVTEGGLNADRARWSAEQLERGQRAWLAGLPDTQSVDVDGLGATLFCHGSPRSDEEILTAISSELRVAEAVAGVSEPVVVCGHTHVQFDRLAAEKRLVNAGSVGMPYESLPAPTGRSSAPGWSCAGRTSTARPRRQPSARRPSRTRTSSPRRTSSRSRAATRRRSSSGWRTNPAARGVVGAARSRGGARHPRRPRSRLDLGE